MAIGLLTRATRAVCQSSSVAINSIGGLMTGRRVSRVPHRSIFTRHQSTLARTDRVAMPVFLDTETTGLLPNRQNPHRRHPRVVEVAAYIPSLNKMFHRLVNPEEHISPHAKSSSYHKINDKMVRDAPPFSEVWPELTGWVDEKAQSPNHIPVWIGHNIKRFDFPVIVRLCKRAGLYKEAERIERGEDPVVDTFSLATNLYAGKRITVIEDGNEIKKSVMRILEFRTLQTLRWRSGTPEDNPHRATGDTRVNHKVWEWLVNGVPRDELNAAFLAQNTTVALGDLIRKKGIFNPDDHLAMPA